MKLVYDHRANKPYSHYDYLIYQLGEKQFVEFFHDQSVADNILIVTRAPEIYPSMTHMHMAMGEPQEFIAGTIEQVRTNPMRFLTLAVL